mmetsp:Transcript_13013/g.47565  ORF Transcript_13013/g.47565 Transcript_13013/m.47565 type:complete len:293 (+) Transcript_13013:186-1064(+)
MIASNAAKTAVAYTNSNASTQKTQVRARPVAPVSSQRSSFLARQTSCKYSAHLRLGLRDRTQKVRMSSVDTVTVSSELPEDETKEEVEKEVEAEAEAEPEPEPEEPKFTPVEPLFEVALESDLGVDYSTLEGLLKIGDWQAADDETREKLCVIAGEGAAERKWVYFTEVANIPVKDLKTMDNLWVSYSGGRFGYSVQKKLWKASKERWSVFFARIDWTTGEQKAYRKWPQEFIYKSDAAEGHLPLTNALRGTQLFEAIFNHPAFDEVQEDKKVDSMEEMSSNVKNALPDWLV